MPISVKHGGGGIDALAGLLRGQGAYATRESQLRGQDMARIYDKQFQDARLAAQLSSQKSIASERNRTQAGIAAANNATRRSMQAASLKASRANSIRQIKATAASQTQAADTAYKRAAVAAGLQSELQEQAFDQRVQEMEEQARIKAEQTKLVYGEEAKRDIATGNKIIAWAKKSLADGSLSPEEARQAIVKGTAMRDGATADAVPDLELKPPPKYAPYAVGTEDDGRDHQTDGAGRTTWTTWEKSKAGIQFAAQIKQQEAAAAEREERNERRYEALKDREDAIYKDMQSGTDEDGKERTYGDAARRYDESHKSLFTSGGPFGPPEDGSPAAPQAPQVQQEPAALPAYEGPWFENPALKGMEITEVDKTLEPEIGSFLVMTRQKSKEWKDKKMSPAMKQAMANAVERLRRAGVGVYDMKLHQ